MSAKKRDRIRLYRLASKISTISTLIQAVHSSVRSSTSINQSAQVITTTAYANRVAGCRCVCLKNMLQLSVKVFIAQVSRGGTETGKFNMTNLIVHSKRNHNKQHEDFHKTAGAKKQTSGSLQQPTQSKTFANLRQTVGGKKGISYNRKDRPIYSLNNIT